MSKAAVQALTNSARSGAIRVLPVQGPTNATRCFSARIDGFGAAESPWKPLFGVQNNRLWVNDGDTGLCYTLGTIAFDQTVWMMVRDEPASQRYRETLLSLGAIMTGA